MNPVRAGRAVLLLLPYALVIIGILGAGNTANSPEGFLKGLQMLAVAGLGAVWAYLRARRAWRDPVDAAPRRTPRSRE